MTPAEKREVWHYVAEGTWNLVGTGGWFPGARYVPNTQFLSIPFRNELIHSAAQVSELSDCTRGFV